MSTFDPITGSQPTRPSQGNVTAQPSPDAERPAATQTDTPEAIKPAQNSAGSNAIAGGFTARLNYDLASDDVIIEILDPQTGEVLRQLPPEDASKELRGGSGRVLDRVA